MTLVYIISIFSGFKVNCKTAIESRVMFVQVYFINLSQIVHKFAPLYCVTSQEQYLGTAASNLNQHNYPVFPLISIEFRMANLLKSSHHQPYNEH